MVTDLDCSAINHNTRSIEPPHSHNGTWHLHNSNTIKFRFCKNNGVDSLYAHDVPHNPSSTQSKSQKEKTRGVEKQRRSSSYCLTKTMT